jgi:D-glycero-D-manno-heptose 1,7-bisphosphate phosphatase
MPARVIFLDRDGTVNVDQGYVSRIADWQFSDRAIDGLRLLRVAGFRLALVTNQSGIARGFYRLEDVQNLHQHVQSLLQAADAPLDAIALCPHGESEECDCRKPRTGMARQIERQLDVAIDYEASWTIGDKISDLQFGKALGTRVALIHSRYWQPGQLVEAPELCIETLYDGACQITGCRIEERG